VVQIGSGSVSGGLGSMIAGGKFWDGFRQGVITAALNHFAHELILKPIAVNRMRSALINGGVDPDANPVIEKSSIIHLIENVDEIGRLYEVGGKPGFEIKHLGGDYGRYDPQSKTVYIAPKAFTSNLSLAFAVGHELVHATHFHSGLYRRLLQKSSNGVAVRNYSEVLAWRWELQWGSPGAPRQIREYTKGVGGWFNIFERMNR